MSKSIGFNIGDWVTVSHQVTVQIVTGKTEIVPIAYPEPTMGQVVGAARKMLGTYHASLSYEGDYDPPSLKVTGSIVVVLVRFGMTNRPVMALAEHVKPAQVGTLPWKYQVNWRNR